MEVRHGSQLHGSQLRPITHTRTWFPPTSMGNGNGNNNGNRLRKAQAVVGEFMQAVEPSFSDHLDRFCSLNDTHVDPNERIQFAALLDDHVDAFETTLSWSLSRLAFSAFGPRDVFPGRLCKRLVTQAISRASSAVMTTLFEDVRALDRMRWAATVEALVDLAQQTRQWTVWPGPAACERTVLLLDALEHPWCSAVERIRLDSRAHDRGRHRPLRRPGAARPRGRRRLRRSERYRRSD